MMNVVRRLKAVVKNTAALQTPTISSLADSEWVAVTRSSLKTPSHIVPN